MWMGIPTQEEAYQQYLEQERKKAQQLPQLAGMAQGYQQGIEGAAPFAGKGFAENTLPALYGGIQGLMQGGMSSQEYGQQRAGLGQGLNQALGRAQSAGARTGYWNPAQVAGGGATGAAYKAYAGGLSGLESERNKIARESRLQGTQVAAGLAGQSADEMKASQTAYGQYLQRLMQRPSGIFSSEAQSGPNYRNGAW